jgi:hypothetical protein
VIRSCDEVLERAGLDEFPNEALILGGVDDVV